MCLNCWKLNQGILSLSLNNCSNIDDRPGDEVMINCSWDIEKQLVKRYDSSDLGIFCSDV